MLTDQWTETVSRQNIFPVCSHSDPVSQTFLLFSCPSSEFKQSPVVRAACWAASVPLSLQVSDVLQGFHLSDTVCRESNHLTPSHCRD